MNLVNGIVSDAISVRDRGLAYGDGVFRTFSLRGAKPVLWQRQYAKLADDCHALKLICPAQKDLERDIAFVATTEPDCIVKIIVTRGEAARGYAMPDKHEMTRLVISNAPPTYPAQYYDCGVQVQLCRLRLSTQPALAGLKHLNRLENVLARAEWSDTRIAEGLMLDTGGNVVCGTMSNLFAVRHDALFTPALTRCGVDGVMRNLVIDLARAHDIPLHIADVTLDELLAADELFVVNSVIGLWPIVTIDGKTWAKGPLTTRLQQLLGDAQGT